MVIQVFIFSAGKYSPIFRHLQALAGIYLRTYYVFLVAVPRALLGLFYV